MWFNDGPQLQRDHPIQFEILGLPAGESALVNQNLQTRPITWRVSLRSQGAQPQEWATDFDTPEDALAAVESRGHTQRYRCPRCDGELTFVRHVDSEIESRGDKIIVPLASGIYECPEHGQWRAFINGSVVEHKRIG